MPTNFYARTVAGGSPDGVVNGQIGDIYQDRSSGALWQNKTGGTTGWVLVGSGGGGTSTAVLDPNSVAASNPEYFDTILSSSWTEIIDGGGFINCGDVSRIDPDLIYAGCDVSGPRVSFEEGIVWHHRGLGIQPNPHNKTMAIAADPTVRSRVYAACGSGTVATSGLYVSDATGNTGWTRLDDPTKGFVFFGGNIPAPTTSKGATYGSGVTVITDTNATWDYIGRVLTGVGIPANTRVTAVSGTGTAPGTSVTLSAATTVANTAYTFTADAATDVLTLSGTHGWATDNPVQVSNSGGALPGGLQANTTYFVNTPSGTTLKLAATAGGAAINITTNGTGTQTITPVGVYTYPLPTNNPRSYGRLIIPFDAGGGVTHLFVGTSNNGAWRLTLDNTQSPPTLTSTTQLNISAGTTARCCRGMSYGQGFPNTTGGSDILYVAVIDTGVPQRMIRVNTATGGFNESQPAGTGAPTNVEEVFSMRSQKSSQNLLFAVGAGFIKGCNQASVGSPTWIDMIQNVPLGSFSATFTADSTTDTITVTQNLASDQPVQVSNSGGGLPAPLVANQTYYVNSPTATAMKLAANPGGAVIDITTNGTGTQTMTTVGVVPDIVGDGTPVYASVIAADTPDASDQRVWVLVGCSNPVNQNASTGAVANVANAYRGFIDFTNVAAGATFTTTWTRLGSEHMNVNRNGTPGERPFWTFIGGQNNMPFTNGAGVVANLRTTPTRLQRVIGFCRGTAIACDNILDPSPKFYVLGRGNGGAIVMYYLPHPTFVDKAVHGDTDRELAAHTLYGEIGRNIGFFETLTGTYPGTNRGSKCAYWDDAVNPAVLYVGANAAPLTPTGTSGHSVWSATSGGTTINVFDENTCPYGKAFTDLNLNTGGGVHTSTAVPIALGVAHDGATVIVVAGTKLPGVFWTNNAGSTWTQLGPTGAAGVYGTVHSESLGSPIVVDNTQKCIYIPDRQHGVWRSRLVSGVPQAAELISNFSIPSAPTGDTCGFIKLDPLVANRLWVSTDTGLRYIDGASSAAAGATGNVGTETFFANGRTGLPGPIAFKTNGIMYMAINGETTTGANATPGFLQIPDPTTFTGTQDLAGGSFNGVLDYRGAMIYPRGVSISADGVYANVWGQGTGVLRRRLV